MAYNKKVYKVAAIGIKGAGKTVYLAALFQQLYNYKSDVGFALELPSIQANKLNAIYGIITEAMWPRGTNTDEYSEWHYTLKSIVNSNGKRLIFKPLGFIYADYAGELTYYTEDNLKGFARKLEDFWADANVSLIVLDGVSIFHLLRGSKDPRVKPDGIPPFLTSLRSLLQTAETNGRKYTAVHFIVTKWDVLENAGITLNQVRERMFSIPDFREFVKNRGSDSPIRLLPISAVGMDFAKYNPDTGKMDIVPNQLPQPWNVEVPLACAFMDHYAVEIREAVEEELQRQKEEAERKATEVDRSVAWWKRLGAGLASIVSSVARGDSGLEKHLQTISQWLSKPQEDRQREIVSEIQRAEADKQENLRKISDEKSAAEAMYSAMRTIALGIEAQYPESTLN